MLLARRGVVEAHHLAIPAVGPNAPADDGGRVLPLAELERRHIAVTLERTGWHQGHTAEMLGISVKTLYRKIREYGFQRPGAPA